MSRLVSVLVVLVSFCTALSSNRTNSSNIEVLLAPPNITVVQIGDTVSFACAAHGLNMAPDPYIYFVRDVGPGPDYPEEGKRLPGIAAGKLIFYLEEVQYDDIDSYKCVIEGYNNEEKIEIPFELDGPELTCEIEHGEGNLVYGAVWQYRTWPEAMADCHSRGLELALPTSEEENTKLVEDLQLAFERDPNSKKFAHENWVWIAAHDMTWDGVWTSAVDEKNLTYTNWDFKQPDNKRGKGKFKSSQDVASLHWGTGRWDDTFSSFKRAYVCTCPKDEASVE